MKKMILSLCLFSVSTLAQIPSPNLGGGLFLGGGTWIDNSGANGSFHSLVEIANNIITSHYSWDGGTSGFALDFHFNGNFFDVTYDGELVGNGSCVGKSCQFDISIAGNTLADGALDIHISEVLTFHNDALHRLGHSIQGDIRLVWAIELLRIDPSELPDLPIPSLPGLPLPGLPELPVPTPELPIPNPPLPVK